MSLVWKPKDLFNLVLQWVHYWQDIFLAVVPEGSALNFFCHTIHIVMVFVVETCQINKERGRKQSWNINVAYKNHKLMLFERWFVYTNLSRSTCVWMFVCINPIRTVIVALDKTVFWAIFCLLFLVHIENRNMVIWHQGATIITYLYMCV